MKESTIILLLFTFTGSMIMFTLTEPIRGNPLPAIDDAVTVGAISAATVAVAYYVAHFVFRFGFLGLLAGLVLALLTHPSYPFLNLYFDRDIGPIFRQFLQALLNRG